MKTRTRTGWDKKGQESGVLKVIRKASCFWKKDDKKAWEGG